MAFTFDPETHEYHYDGRRLYHITEVLKKAGLVRAMSNEYHLWVGSATHKAIELHNRGTLDEARLDERLRGPLDAWKFFLTATGFKVREFEAMKYHLGLGVATTLDILGEFPDGSPGLVEIKSGNVMPWTGIQTAGQATILNKPYVKRFGLKVGKDGRPQITPFEDRDDYQVFLAALTLARWFDEH